jgi:hypothetical protein
VEVGDCGTVLPLPLSILLMISKGKPVSVPTRVHVCDESVIHTWTLIHNECVCVSRGLGTSIYRGRGCRIRGSFGVTAARICLLDCIVDYYLCGKRLDNRK